MSDRISSPVSSSPGRSAPIARPTWPWQPSSLRSSTASSSTSSVQDCRTSASGSPAPRSISRLFSNPSSSSMWQSTMSSRTAATLTMATTSRGFQDDATRQWSFMGFEWLVRDVHKLKDFVEVVAVGAGDPEFEILKHSPVLGDNKFKLEIDYSSPREGSSGPPTKQTLSLYITSLTVDSAHLDYELSASMMAAIKCQADRSGERGSPPEWVWEFWQTNWVFRKGNEVWECPLPPFSTLLENSRIRETDSLVICVQIQCPSGPSFPQQPYVHSVPRDLLDGLEASLDNANTGDVRFICLERLSPDVPISPAHGPPTPTNSRSLSRASAYSPFSSRTTARKRVIYGHSDILTRRSEYFGNMLTSAFSENVAPAAGERKIYTIVVEEADFETIYWLLKFCYGNWLLFREDDDPRMAMDSIGSGWITKWSNLPGGEWDWKTFQKDDSDARSVASGESRVSATESRTSPLETLQAPNPNPVPVGPSSPLPASNSQPAMTHNNQGGDSSSSRRSISTSTVSPANHTSSRTRPKPSILPVSTMNYPSSRQVHPACPRTGRPSTLVVLDPHPHPTSPPKPASALSMYQVAHRYGMPGLASLALEHMMSTLTPQTCFPLLLATSIWDEPHLLVEDYVVEKWDDVSTSEEFEHCCQEVAAGEWGSDGGKTLMSIFRRLRAP